MPGPYSAGTIFLQVVPSYRDLQNSVRRQAREAEKAFGEEFGKGTETEKGVDKALGDTRRTAAKHGDQAGDDYGGAFQKAFRKRMKEAAASISDIKVDADTSAADRKLAEVRRKLITLSDVHIGVDMDAGAALAEAAVLERELKSLDGERVNINTHVDVLATLAALELLKREVGSLDGKDVKINTKQSGAEATSAANAFRAFSGIVIGVALLGPLVIPALAGIAAGILGISAAAVGGGAALGVLALGLSGIGAALKAHSALSKQSAADAQTHAKAVESAASAVRDAQRSLDRAREDSARSAEDAARRVEDAQTSLVRAQEQAARSTEDALRRQQDAEQALADAQRNAADAQRDLLKARQEAAADQEDLSNRIAEGTLAERQAVVDLFDATVAYNAARTDPGATNKEKEEASIALARAKLSLKEIRENNKALRAEQQKSKKQGVEGSDRVVAAQEAVNQAVRREKDARQDVADANQGVADARIQAARDVADAEQNVTDALRDQQRAADDAAYAIESAQLNLADAQARLTEAQNNTSTAAKNLKYAMDQLSPAGRAFVEFLWSLRKQFKLLRDAAQEGLLPGLMTGIKEILTTWGPQILQFVKVFSKAVGDAFAYFAHVLVTAPSFAGFFQTLLTLGPKFFNQFIRIMTLLGEIFADLFTGFAPLMAEMGDAIIGLLDSTEKWLRSKKGRDALVGFMGWVRKYAPVAAKFIGALVLALVNLVRALSPYAGTLAAVFTAILDFIAGMDPSTLSALVISVIAIVLGLQAFFAIVSLLGPVLTAISLGFGGLVGTVAAIVGILALLVIAFIFAYSKSETFRDIVNGAFKAIGIAVGIMWKIVKAAFDIIIGVFKAAWWFIKNVLYPIFTVLWEAFLRFTPMGQLIRQVWLNIIKPVFNAIRQNIHYVVDAFEWAVTAIGDLWDSLKDKVRAPLFFVVDKLINNGLIDGFNYIADFLGAKKIKKIPLGALRDHGPSKYKSASTSGVASAGGHNLNFAGGGEIPGFSPSPTADNIPAWLTAGEYVLPVAAVRRLRARFGDGFLEMLRRGLPGFAGGGSVDGSLRKLLDFGYWLQARGYQVGENPHFGGVTAGAHVPGSYHYIGRAIDVNADYGFGKMSEKQAIDKIIPNALALKLHTLWQVAGHYDHAHFDTAGTPSALGKAWNAIKGFGGNAILRGITGLTGDPLKYLRNSIAGKLGNSKLDSPFGGFLKHAVHKILGLFEDEAKHLLHIGGNDKPDPEEHGRGGYAGGRPPTLFDSGGYLPPGLSSVLNATGRPEPVLTPDQWEKMGGGDRRPLFGDITIPVTGESPQEIASHVASELLWTIRKVQVGSAYETAGGGRG